MAVAHDATVIGNNGTGATTAASAALTTGGANRLLLATIAITNASSQTVSSISGGGLTWALVPSGARSNGTSQRVEVWYAFATSALSAQTITATLSASAAAAIVVSSYSGTNTQGINGLGAIGTVASATGTSTAPSVIIQTLFTNSLCTGHLAAALAVNATAGSNQTINGQDHGTVTPLATQQRQDSSTVASGTSVTNNLTITSATWAIVAVEIISDGIQVANNVSGGVSTGTSKSAGTTITNLSFTKPSSRGWSIIVAFAMDDDGASPGTISCADSASGATYTKDIDRSAGGTGTGARVAIFSAHNVVGSLLTVTVTHPSVTARAMEAMMVAGIDTFDVNGSAAGSGTSPSSGVTGTRTQAAEILIGAIAAETPNDSTFTVGTNFSRWFAGTTFDNGTTGGGGASNMSIGAEFQIVSATGTDAATATISSADWAAAIATYYLTPPAAAAIPNKIYMVRQAVSRSNVY